MPKKILLLIIIFITSPTLAACNKTHPVNNNQSEIKIGLIGPYTGDAAALGIPSKIASEYATDTINALGGINGHPIKLIPEDGQCDPKTASTVTNKLINIDKVKFIIGGFCSGETLGASPIAEKNKTILLSPASSHPDISNAGDYIFRIYPSDAYQGKFAADYIFHHLNIQHVSVIATNLDYPQGIKRSFIDSFKQFGGTIDHQFDIEPEEKKFQTILTKIKQSKSQLIYTSVHLLDQAIEIIKTTQELELKLPLFGIESWDDPTNIQANANLFEGAYYSSIPNPQSSNLLINEIKKRCSSCDIMPGTLQSYDAVFILAQAIKKGSPDNVEATRQALYETSYDGLSGHIELDSNGDLKQTKYQVKKIEDGQIKIIYP